MIPEVALRRIWWRISSKFQRNSLYILKEGALRFESTKVMSANSTLTRNDQESAWIFNEFFASVIHSNDHCPIFQIPTHFLYISDLTIMAQMVKAHLKRLSEWDTLAAAKEPCSYVCWSVGQPFYQNFGNGRNMRWLENFYSNAHRTANYSGQPNSNLLQSHEMLRPRYCPRPPDNKPFLERRMEWLCTNRIFANEHAMRTKLYQYSASHQVRCWCLLFGPQKRTTL